MPRAIALDEMQATMLEIGLERLLKRAGFAGARPPLVLPAELARGRFRHRRGDRGLVATALELGGEALQRIGRCGRRRSGAASAEASCGRSGSPTWTCRRD